MVNRTRFDLLPAVNGGHSCRAAHAAPRRVPASLATARGCPGLTLPPQAFCVSASPAATRMLRAALTSRSWTTPHAWQAQARTPSGLGPSRCPHAEQICEVGSQRPILTTRRPCWAAFSSSSRTKVAQPASWTLLASRVRAKPGHAQVLDGDHLVLADQPQGELVVMIGPPVADLAMRDRDPVAGLGAVGRSLPLAGELPLCASELPLRGAQVPRVGNLLDRAVTADDCRQPDQAEVDPGSTRHRRQRGRVALDHERGVEAAVRLAEDGDAGRHRRQRPRPAHPHLADLGHIQPGPVQGEAVAGEPDRLTAVLAPEPGCPTRRPLRLPERESNQLR